MKLLEMGMGQAKLTNCCGGRSTPENVEIERKKNSIICNFYNSFYLYYFFFIYIYISYI